jgi:hypothetical protein
MLGMHRDSIEHDDPGPELRDGPVSKEKKLHIVRAYDPDRNPVPLHIRGIPVLTHLNAIPSHQGQRTSAGK